jgi:hypothetical protein
MIGMVPMLDLMPMHRVIHRFVLQRFFDTCRTAALMRIGVGLSLVNHMMRLMDIMRMMLMIAMLVFHV